MKTIIMGGALAGIIPSGVSEDNKLVDQQTLSEAVATMSGNYISDSGQPFSSLTDLNAYSGTKAVHDYAYVKSVQGDTEFYIRYTWDGSLWREEFRINSTEFSPTQWAAINSGIDTDKVTRMVLKSSNP